MTSVSGHLLNYDFVGQYRKWSNTNPIVLFEAPVQKICISSNEAVKVILFQIIYFWVIMRNHFNHNIALLEEFDRRSKEL